MNKNVTELFCFVDDFLQGYKQKFRRKTPAKQ